MSQTHLLRKLFDGRVRLETQNQNPMIYARAYVQGKLRVFRTMHTNEHSAAKAAGDWYLALLHRVRSGERLDAATFGMMAEKFMDHADANGKPSPLQRRNYRHKWSLLQSKIAGIRDIAITDIDTGWLERVREVRDKDKVKPTTIKKDLMFISSVLNFAKNREKALETLPDFPSFTDNWRIETESRPAFTPAQYKKLISSARRRMREPDLNPRVRRQREELYVLIVVMMGAALRPGEAYSLRWRDARLDQIADDGLFHMSVLGKHRGPNSKREDAFMKRVGFFMLRRLFKNRDRAQTTLDSSIFTENHRDGFRLLLEDCNLRVDKRTERTRDLKSLRPTALTRALDRQATPDYRATAKWARTSPDILLKWYDKQDPSRAARKALLNRRG